MAGPARRPLEGLADAADDHRRRCAVLVHLGRVRREQHIDAGALSDGRVARLVARIRLEIGGVVELRRVHEQRHDGDLAVDARAPHQRQVPLVEVSHRRYEADSGALPAAPVERAPQLGDLANDPHD